MLETGKVELLEYFKATTGRTGRKTHPAFSMLRYLVRGKLPLTPLTEIRPLRSHDIPISLEKKSKEMMLRRAGCSVTANNECRGRQALCPLSRGPLQPPLKNQSICPDNHIHIERERLVHVCCEPWLCLKSNKE
ncbi:hypothetical protein PoB_004618700 [Plakobranchus ocellatus]|uniref:Uncharacterized protein n=1 Tax=Plakobranchus ocellatus TaxID=259542 RepID=A0AAV4BL93_9GAST|nr:hypothetical protein PoB_004618700 [Plakobranchus ocellatus]